MKKILSLVLGIAFVASASVAQADVFVNETFSHADGDLVGQTPTPGPGATWVAHSGAGNSPIQVSSGVVTLVSVNGGGSGEDVNTSFTAIGATDTIYAGFDFSLASGQTVATDSSGLYFAHFKNSGSGFRSRMGVLTATGSGDYSIAINANNANLGAGALWGADLDFDTIYRAVISYNAATGASRLWVNPTDELSTSVVDDSGTAGTLIEAFALRQSNDYAGSQNVDNLLVADNFNQAFSAVPEPTTFGFLVFGLVGLAARRRRS